MKTTRYFRIALAALLSTILIPAASFADSPDDDNSVHNWGPWGKMVTPTAGPAPVFAVQLPEGFNYEPTRQGTTPTVVEGPEELPLLVPSPRLARFDMILEHGEGFAEGSFIVSDLSTGSPAADGAGIGWATYNGPVDEGGNVPFINSVVPMEGTSNGFTFAIDGVDGGTGQQSSLSGAIAPWIDTTAYTSLLAPPVGWVNTIGPDTAAGQFIWGISTPLQHLENMAAGNAIATYSGFTLNHDVPFEINVEFGPAIWNGIWNTNGADTAGKLGFEASGNLNGANLITNSITANDPGLDAISGNVEGALIGDNAAHVIGGYEISKRVNGIDNTQTDLFSADRLPQPN